MKNTIFRLYCLFIVCQYEFSIGNAYLNLLLDSGFICRSVSHGRKYVFVENMLDYKQVLHIVFLDDPFFYYYFFFMFLNMLVHLQAVGNFDYGKLFYLFSLLFFIDTIRATLRTLAIVVIF